MSINWNNHIDRLRSQISDLRNTLRVIKTKAHDERPGLEQTTAQLRELVDKNESQKTLYQFPKILHKILHNPAVGAIILGPNGEHLLFNAAAERLLGSDLMADALAEKSGNFGFYFTDKVTRYTKEQLPWQQAVQGKQVPEVDLFVRRQGYVDGLWIKATSTALKSEHNDIGGAVIFLVDITEQVQVENQIQSTCEALEQQITQIGSAQLQLQLLTEKLGKLDYLPEAVPDLVAGDNSTVTSEGRSDSSESKNQPENPNAITSGASNQPPEHPASSVEIISTPARSEGSVGDESPAGSTSDSDDARSVSPVRERNSAAATNVETPESLQDGNTSNPDSVTATNSANSTALENSANSAVTENSANSAVSENSANSAAAADPANAAAAENSTSAAAVENPASTADSENPTSAAAAEDSASAATENSTNSAAVEDSTNSTSSQESDATSTPVQQLNSAAPSQSNDITIDSASVIDYASDELEKWVEAAAGELPSATKGESTSLSTTDATAEAPSEPVSESPIEVPAVDGTETLEEKAKKVNESIVQQLTSEIFAIANQATLDPVPDTRPDVQQSFAPDSTENQSTNQPKPPFGAVGEKQNKSKKPVSKGAEAVPPDEHSGKRRKILIVDDIPVNQKLLRLQLKRLGFECEAANNGDAAQKAVANGDFALVLMDLDMPIMDGFESTAAIRRNEQGLNKRIPIVAMTSYDRQEDRERCLAAGMDDFLSKGATQKQLHEVVERCMSASSEDNSAKTLSTPAEPLKETGLDIESLQKQFDKEEVQDVSRLFLSAVNTFIDCIQLGIEEKDAGAVTHFAHSVKGPCAALGIDEMTRLTSEIMSDAEAGNWTQVRVKYMKLKSSFGEVRDQLRELCTPGYV